VLYPCRSQQERVFQPQMDRATVSRLHASSGPSIHSGGCCHHRSSLAMYGLGPDLTGLQEPPYILEEGHRDLWPRLRLKSDEKKMKKKDEKGWFRNSGFSHV
jgi:hypothetical protein